MLEKAGDLTNKTIMVMFNLELLEGLYQRGLIDRVTFIADNEKEEKFAKAFYKVRTFKYDTEAWANLDKTMEDIMAKMNVAPDITLTNPPYNGNIDLKILLALKKSNLLKKLICVHPATWLVDCKGINSLFKDFRVAFEVHTLDLDLFNGNQIFNIELFVPCVITIMDMCSSSYKPKKVKWFNNEEWEISSFDEITMHGRAWDPLVLDFYNKIKTYLSTHANMHDQLINSADGLSNKYYIQLAAIRGHTADKSKNKMFQDDMYTLIQKSFENNKGIRNNSRDNNVLQIGTKIEQENLLKYLQLDFTRLCLSLLKINQHIECGELAMVPWMDFTRSWTDDELFSELGYHKGHAIREYAKKFLPDYHNIYPNGKTY